MFLMWAFIGGITCALIAQHQGRNRLLAAIMGLAFGLFATLVYAVMGPKHRRRRKRRMPAGHGGRARRRSYR